MAEVIVNVKANTGQATQEVNNLDDALNNAEQSADDLSSSLERQEARIKTLGGAINIVGGSVEVLAGSLALSGALTEEQVEQFEAAAIGAIAFADGAKRVFEGYKELSEGIRAYGGAAKIAQAIQARFNATILANPYVAAAAAIAALTAGIYFFIKAQEDEEEQVETTTEKLKRQREELEKLNRQYFNAEEQLIILEQGAKIRNTTIAEEIQLQKDRIAEQRKLYAEDLKRQRSATIVDENAIAAIKIKQEEADKYEKQILAAEALYIKTSREAAEANRKAREEARNTRLEYEGMMQTIEQTVDEVIDSLNIFSLDNPLDEPLESLQEINEELEDIIFFTREQLDEFNKATEINEDQSFEARRARIAAYYDDLIQQAASNAHQVEQLERAKNKTLDQLDQERNKNIEDAAKATLSTTIGLLATIRETTDDGSKEGFEKSKKFRIAETRLSSIQASFDAYKSLVGVPFVGPILAVAAAAAALAAGQKAINDIKSSTFSDQSAPSGVSGGTASGAGFNPAGLGGAQQTLVTSIPPAERGPVRAYVVTGDVVDGIEAESQINSRRTFGPG